jgi:4-alpha-glucanotransferase
LERTGTSFLPYPILVESQRSLTELFTRSSGVQLHLTSLPGGRLGPEAYAWVDFLAAAGQSWWQVLPLGPPDRHRSPYKSRSAFAAWRGFLADPGAAVSRADREAFAARHPWVTARDVADQVRFEREWGALRAYAADRGVRIIGDVPIYVAPGSDDVRAHPELFLDGLVAGAPPDALADRGQLWGNPVYDWPALRRRGYRWWLERMQRAVELFDVARIDHFRGFVAGWTVPEGARDARAGRWRRGPGRALFDAARARLGALPFIAEDLGVITEPVDRLRRELGLPGMVVLQFAFDPDDESSPHRLEHHTTDRVAYTGTHDTDTLAGWLATMRHPALLPARDVRGLTEWWMTSPAPLVMLQAQDLLELGSEARMNTPGRATGNWAWRLPAGALTPALARRLKRVTTGAGRAP